MAGKTGKNKSVYKGGWLRLSLELISVFVGVTAGFLVNNYGEDRANRKLEMAVALNSINHALKNSLTTITQ